MSLSFESTSKAVEIGGVTVHYHEAGEGSPLIMIHGGGPGAGGWTNFHRNIEELSKFRRVILPDLVGFGRSSRVEITNTLYTFHAEMILKFMDAIGVEDADFVGNSLGGGVVMRLMLTSSSRVSSAVLMGPGGAVPLFSSWPTLGLKLGMQYYQGGGPTKEKLRALLEMMVWDKNLITEELVNSRYLASIDPDTLKNPPLSKGGKLNDESLWNEDLSKITQRVLLVWGRDDDILPFDGGLVLLRRLPNAELHVIPQCGHWVMWERPDLFNQVVSGFLAH